MEQQPDTFESSSKTENNKTAKKQTAKYIAIAAAAVAVTAGAIFALKKGKSVKLENIKFDKGIASLKDGTKFTGKIKDKLKNGDKIVMEYADGVLQKSTRSGAKNIEKVYEVAQNGDKIVKQTIDGVQKAPVNITKITNEVKSQQSKLQTILKDVNLSSQELQQKTGEINFKSAKQKEYIKNTIADKKDAELKAKAEAERIAKEAEEKARAEAERIAKEKAAKEAEEKAKAEAERIAKEKAAKEAETKAKAEAERIAKEKAAREAKRNKRTLEIKHAEDKDIVLKQNLSQDDIEVLGLYSDSSNGSNAEVVTDEMVSFLEHLETLNEQEVQVEISKLSANQKRKVFNAAQTVQLRKEMNAIIDKAPPIEEDCTVYRTIRFCESGKKFFSDSDFEVGKVIKNPGITSTARMDTPVFNHFIAGSSAETDYVLRVHLPKGTKCAPAPMGEVVLPAGNSMKITGFNPKTKVVDVEYISPTK